MKTLDKILQQWRFAQVKPYLPQEANLLDIGCHQGEMLQQWAGIIRSGVGIDPLLERPIQVPANIQLIRGSFPEGLAQSEKFSCISALAVVEHIPQEHIADFFKQCHKWLLPKGRLMITVPSQRTDILLRWLLKLHLVHGMSLEEHHGYNPENTPAFAAEAGFKLLVHKRFQLKFNNVFVFEK